MLADSARSARPPPSTLEWRAILSLYPDYPSFDRRLKIAPPHPLNSRTRIGPDGTRPASARREFVTFQARLVDKERAEELRVGLIRGGRIPPFWEVFARLVDVGEDVLALDARQRGG